MIIKNLLLDSVEYNSWGLNLVTISFIMTILLSLIQGYGIIKQIKLLNKTKSARALSIILFSYQFVFFMSYIIYGYSRNSLAIMCSSLVGFLFLPLVVKIARLKSREKEPYKRDLFISSLFLVLVPITYLSANKAMVIISMLAGSGLSLIPQFLAMRKGGTENIAGKFIAAFAINSSTWLVYGICTLDIALIISSSTTLGAIILLLLFKIKYSEARNL